MMVIISNTVLTLRQIFAILHTKFPGILRTEAQTWKSSIDELYTYHVRREGPFSNLSLSRHALALNRKTLCRSLSYLASITPLLQGIGHSFILLLESRRGERTPGGVRLHHPLLLAEARR